MKNTRYLLFLFFTIISCQKQEDNFQIINEQDLNLATELNKSRIATSELLFVKNFFVKDSFIVVRNDRDDSLFVIYKLPEFDCHTAFGKKGKGPNEFIMPKIIDKPSSEHFFIADFSLNKLRSFDLKEDQMEDVKFNFNGDLPQSINYTLDSVFIFDTNQRVVNLHKMEKNGTSKVLNDFNELQKKYEHSSIYWGFLGVNDSLKKVVYAYQFLRRFDIMDYNGEVLK